MAGFGGRKRFRQIVQDGGRIALFVAAIWNDRVGTEVPPTRA
ncbi:DUF6053 domain-containing protein [Lysobacter enzymogenes]